MDYENLTPQYRIEEYLEAIVEGWAEATRYPYPDYPSWRIEEFLDAFITYIWEDGDHPRKPCPEPVWRLEKCLRAIYDVMTGAATPWAFPTPTNRIEEYLAAIHAYLADNTELPVPEPVWRIEQWLAYVLEGVKQGGGIEKTVSGSPAHITDALAKAALSVLVNITPIQPGSGDPSPDNVRPISGRTGLSVYRTGVNVWDEVWELGGINGSGNNQSGTDRIRSKNYIPVTPGATYYFYINSTYGIYTWGYDSSKNYVGRVPSNGWAIGNNTVTIPNGVYYIRIVVQPGYGTTYNNDISINYPSTDTDYHAYNGATYSLDWTSEAGTVYGGTLDVVTGVLTADRAMVDLGTLTWSYANSIFVATLPSDSYNYASSANAISDCYAFVGTIQNGTLDMQDKADCSFALYYNKNYPTSRVVYVKNTAYTDAAAFKTAMDGHQLVYELATPLTYQLTPQEVQMLLGENYVWSSSGDTVSVTYYAEGNANPLQSLNILLGGNYSNPKTADDVSDKEALDIILGGNK